MTAQNGLFVQTNGPGTGTTARQARLSVAGLLSSNSWNPFDVRAGVIFTGPSVSLVSATASTAPMTVLVNPMHWVVSHASSDGAVLGSNDAALAVALPAPPALGSKRIDVVYAQQQDANASVSPDALTQGTFGVLTGAASSSPVKPANLPAGAVEVGTVTYDCTSVVPTKSTDAQVTVTASGPLTSLRGTPIPVRTKAERDGLSPTSGMRVLRLDKGGLVQTYDGSKWRGQRRHADTKTLTTDASGYITVTHGAGFTPGAVTVVPVSPITGSVTGSIFGFALCDTFSASTFRLRALFANGVQISSASVAFSYECVEAQD